MTEDEVKFEPEEEEEEILNYFLIVWDEFGLENIVDITEYEPWAGAEALRELAGQKKKGSPADTILSGMLLRARFNGHRSYEIYGLRTSVEKESLEQMFCEQPQVAANLIRSRGVSFLRRGSTPKQIQIT